MVVQRTALLALSLPVLAHAQAANEYTSLSPSSIKALQEALGEQIYPTTVAQYSISTFVLWASMYFAARVIEVALRRYTKSFQNISFPSQRACVIYVLNTFWTTVALILQLVSIQVLREEFTVVNVRIMRVISVILSVLYLFEITYRPAMQSTMLLHHFCTIFAIIFIQTSLQMTSDPSTIVTGLYWYFQATTEQSIFIALLLYRFWFKPATVQRVMRGAAIQALIVKMAFGVCILVWWGKKQVGHKTAPEVAFSCVVVLAMSVLMFTQFYGSWVVWKLATSYAKKYELHATSSAEHRAPASPATLITRDTTRRNTVSSADEDKGVSRSSDERVPLDVLTYDLEANSGGDSSTFPEK